MDLASAVIALEKFSGQSLSRTLARIESDLKGVTDKSCSNSVASVYAGPEALIAAAALKRASGQINVIVHALGILICLPHILEPGEMVEQVSLGAGNTGRKFDLETNYRIAEFKFIRWRGGSESIRQNSIFKDFFQLAESTLEKRKYLYVLGTEYPLKFLQGRRTLTSVLSKDETARNEFHGRFGNLYQRVREYFAEHNDKVIIEDVSHWLPALMLDELEE